MWRRRSSTAWSWPATSRSTTATGRSPGWGCRPWRAVAGRWPGLVDLQVNGFDGVEFRRADPDGYAAAARSLAAHGAPRRSSRPSSRCSLDDYDARSLGPRAGARRPAGRVPLPAGAHLEGPFLSPDVVRRPPDEYFVAPGPAVVDRLLAAGPVSLHDAGARTGRRARPGGTAGGGRRRGQHRPHRRRRRAGAPRRSMPGPRHVTHCWNAHRRFAPRDPGPAGVALTDAAAHRRASSPTWCTSRPRSCALTLPPRRRAAWPPPPMPSRPAGIGLDRGPNTAAPSWSTTGARPAWRRHAGRQRRHARPGPAQPGGRRVRRCAAAVDACGGAQRRLLGLPEVRLRPGDPADVVVLDDDLQPGPHRGGAAGRCGPTPSLDRPVKGRNTSRHANDERQRDRALLRHASATTSDPTLLLVPGLGAQCVGYDDDAVRAARRPGRPGASATTTATSGCRPTSTACEARSDDRGGGGRWRASRSRRPYTLSDMAADGMGLLDALGIESAHVVGSSMGGMIAQTMAIEHPERVLSLTSIYLDHRASPTSARPTPRCWPALWRSWRRRRTARRRVAAGVELARLIGTRVDVRRGPGAGPHRDAHRPHLRPRGHRPPDGGHPGLRLPGRGACRRWRCPPW